MNLVCIATAFLSIFVAQLAYSLDFRLDTVSVIEDGFSHQHSYFQGEAGNKTSIDLPYDWASVSDEQSISVSPRNLSNCEIRVSKSPLTPQTAFNESTLDIYRNSVKSLIPRDAVNLRIIEEKPSPLPVFNWKDYEFVASYNLYGELFKRSMIFISLNPKEQILVSAVSPDISYEFVHKTALELMFSWCSTPSQR